MDLTQLIELAQGGVVVLLVAAVIALWRRLNVVTDAFTQYLIESAVKGDTAAQNALQRRETANARST